MFLFIWFNLLFTRNFVYALQVDSSVSEPIDITFTSNCQPDVGSIVGIELGNNGKAPVIFNLKCSQGMFNVTLNPYTRTTFPVTFSLDADEDLCLMTPSTTFGQFSVYIVASETLGIVIDHTIICDMWSEPPRPVIHYETNCLSDENGIVEITLINPELFPLQYYIECWSTWYQLELAPGFKMSFPATLYRGDINYGTAIYDGVEQELCAFWPWTPDGMQLVLVTSDPSPGSRLNPLFCKPSHIEDDLPLIEISSDCFPDPSGVFGVNIHNRKNESVELGIFCYNDWISTDIPPLGTIELPSVFQRQYHFDYVRDACVLQIWSEHRPGDQLLWVFSEEADMDFTTNMFACEELPPHPVRYSLTCQPDEFGLVPLRLENNLPTPVVFVAESLRLTSKIVLEPRSAVYPAVTFNKGGDADYPTNVFILQQLTEDGIQGLYGVVAIDHQAVLDDYLYCDTRADPPRPFIPYETRCETEDFRTTIRLINRDAVPLTLNMTCKDTDHSLTLPPNTVMDFQAALYVGNIDYGTADYAGNNRSICVFKPRVSVEKQVLFLTTQRPGQAALSFNIYCKTPIEVSPPAVIVGSTCQPDSGDTFDVFFHNDENEAVNLEIICGNSLYNFRLEADDSLTLPAKYYRGDGHFYPNDTCAFMKYDLLWEEQYIYVYSETEGVKFESKNFCCEKKNPVTLHNGYVSTTCQANVWGVVDIPVSNDGDQMLAFTLRCQNGNFETRLQPGEVRTLSAVFFRGEDVSYPEDTCVFSPSNTATVQSIMISVDVGASEQEFTIEKLICDIGQWPFRPFIMGDTNCRPNQAGEITVSLKNDGDEPITYYVMCWLKGMVVDVDPHSVKTFPAVFFNGSNGSDDFCMFSPWSASGWQSILVRGLTSNQPRTSDYLYCKTSAPSDPPNVNFQSTCTPAASGVLVLQLNNDDDEEVSIRVGCENEWFTMKLAPHSTSAFPAVFNEGEGKEYPPNTCVFFDRTEFFMTRQYVWIFSEKDDGQYTETNYLCDKRLPPHPGPIVSLIPHCASTVYGVSSLELKAEVPAYAKAKCRNGNKTFSTLDHVTYTLDARFDEVYSGQDCLFYRKEGSNTFTVDVEIGWGDVNTQIIANKDTRTVSCSYDDHGEDESTKEVIKPWFISPKENQNLMGDNSTAVFDLNVLDILDNQIDMGDIPIGRKIRLKAVDISGTASAFRALSCDAVNEVTRYAILRAGCGDGLVFHKNAGFMTEGDAVFSPYFEAFKLRGDNSLRFQCRFTVCNSGTCDGDSCKVQSRKKRSISTESEDSRVPLSQTEPL